MRRIFFAIFIFGIFCLITHKTVYALASCPSSEMLCSELDVMQGGCTSPCIRVVTQAGSPGPHGFPASCQCQVPNSSPGTVPVGGVCQVDSDCADPGKYCYGGFAQTPTCHIDPNPMTSGGTTINVCDYAGTKKSDCTDCTSDGQHMWTALGCISTNPSQFVGQVLGIGTGICGGIALLLILFGGFQMLMSSGNPEQLNAGKELVTSAIAGLLIIVFSIFLLRLIGVTILEIPGFH